MIPRDVFTEPSVQHESVDPDMLDLLTDVGGRVASGLTGLIRAFAKEYDYPVRSCDLGRGDCDSVSNVLVDFLEDHGVSAVLLSGEGFVPPLGEDAEGLWIQLAGDKAFQETPDKGLMHVVVLVGDTVVDLTGRQFGSDYADPIYSLSEFKRRWERTDSPRRSNRRLNQFRQMLLRGVLAAEDLTPSDVHDLADDLDIPWDDDPDFMAFCEQVVGEGHLDDMTPAELGDVADAMRRSKEASVIVPDPYKMTREEFLRGQPEPKADPGFQLLYHVTSSESLEGIAKHGLLTRFSKSPPRGSIWASSSPDAFYGGGGSMVVFQVPKRGSPADKDVATNKVKWAVGDSVVLFRDVPPADIIAIDPNVKGQDRLSFFQSNPYAEKYWDMYFAPQSEMRKEARTGGPCEANAQGVAWVSPEGRWHAMPSGVGHGTWVVDQLVYTMGLFHRDWREYVTVPKAVEAMALAFEYQPRPDKVSTVVRVSPKYKMNASVHRFLAENGLVPNKPVPPGLDVRRVESDIYDAGYDGIRFEERRVPDPLAVKQEEMRSALRRGDDNLRGQVSDSAYYRLFDLGWVRVANVFAITLGKTTSEAAGDSWCEHLLGCLPPGEDVEGRVMHVDGWGGMRGEVPVVDVVEHLCSRSMQERFWSHLVGGHGKTAGEPRYKKKKKVPKADGSGETTVYVYSERQVQNRNRQKAERLEKLRHSIDDLMEQVQGDLDDEEPKKRLTALAIALIHETFERVGNDGSADEGHYGVTGWLKEHVTFSKGKARIKYIGKSGVEHDKEVTDKKLVSALRGCCEDKKPDEPLLSFGKDDSDGVVRVTSRDVNAYLEPYDISAKDLRGFHANSTMQEELRAARKRGGKLPDDKKEREKQLKAEFKEALEATAEAVGHEPSTLKSQYLVPGMEDQFLKDGTVKDKLKVASSTRVASLYLARDICNPNTTSAAWVSPDGEVHMVFGTHSEWAEDYLVKNPEFWKSPTGPSRWLLNKGWVRVVNFLVIEIDDFTTEAAMKATAEVVVGCASKRSDVDPETTILIEDGSHSREVPLGDFVTEWGGPAVEKLFYKSLSRRGKWATKSDAEKEDAEAERLVRPSPKLKPPRSDKKREKMQVEDDPDMDSSDGDLSLNYKDVGG